MTLTSKQKEIPRICVIILNWNGKEDTLACLESARSIQYDNYQIILVDNGSHDDTVVAVRAKFDDVVVIENHENLGFAEGNNVGIRYAIEQQADYVYLLNNDAIVDPHILTAFMEAIAQYPKAGILGSKIYFFNQPNTIWYAGARWLTRHARFAHDGWGEVDDGKSWEAIKETPYICGCSLLVKAEVIEQIGLMDPRFFLTWEEVDWCYRARKAGYQCLLVPASKVWHKVSASFGGDRTPHQLYFLTRNRLLWAERNISFKDSIWLGGLTVKEIIRQGWIYLSWNTSDTERFNSKAVLQGFKDYFSRKFGNCPAWINFQRPIDGRP